MLALKRTALFLLPLSWMAMTSYAGQVDVPSTGLHLLDKAKIIKAVAPEKELSFTVWLKIRNKAGLDQLVRDIYDPDSPHYQHFLTAEAYEQEYAPAKETEEAMQTYFTAYGMQARVVNHSIRVTGTVKQIEAALHTQINYYRYDNKVVHANAHAPQLNEQLAVYVSAITGLSTIPEIQEMNLKSAHNLEMRWNNFQPQALPTDISLQGFSGVNLQKTYNLSNIPKINGTRLNGAGQTLVIVDKCGTNTRDQILRDANQYFTMNGITPFVLSGPGSNFAMVNPDGSDYKHCPGATAYSREIMLDIESSHTIATGANTVLVLGDSDQRTILADTISTLVHNHHTIGGFSNAYVISNSWGGVESSGEFLETSLQWAAASGISVNFSSGDCGDNTYNTAAKCTAYSASPTVNYPASSPYVTAVGATALFVDTHYRYAFETVWGAVRHSAYDGGTGGGISQFYGPVQWQDGISNFTAGGYGVINMFSSLRAVPDIAMLGDPSTGLLIISQGAQVKDGGTSLACPLFSATLVLVNQARALLGKGTPIGQAAPYLYQKNNVLLANRALNLIIPPALIISGATPPPDTTIQGTPAPASAFTINNTTFGWDSSLTVEPEAQFWNDAVGVGSPNIPNFVMTMANM